MTRNDPSNQLSRREFAELASPTGGNDAVTVTYGPMLQLRFGRVF